MRPPICRWLRNRKRLPSLLVPLSPVSTEPYTKFPQRTPNRESVRLRSLNTSPQDHALCRYRLGSRPAEIQVPSRRYRGAGAENGAGARDCSLRQEFRGSSMLAAVAKQMARRRISALSILEGDPAVNSDRAITFGTLHAPPLTTRAVAHD